MPGPRIVTVGVLCLLTSGALGATTVTLNSLSGTTNSQLGFTNQTYTLRTVGNNAINASQTGFAGGTEVGGVDLSPILSAGPNNGLNATISNTLPGGPIVVNSASLVWAVSSALTTNAAYASGTTGIPVPVTSAASGYPNPTSPNIARLVGITIGSASYTFASPVSSFSGDILALNAAFAGQLAAGNSIILTWQQASTMLQIGATNPNYANDCKSCTTNFTVSSSISSTISGTTGLTIDYGAVSAVPEPSAYAFVAGGLLMMVGLARRRDRS